MKNFQQFIDQEPCVQNQANWFTPSVNDLNQQKENQ
jgi:hypothetical protein